MTAGNHGRFYPDERARREWHNPEELLNSVGLQQGMTFIDVGCGDGFFTLIAAKIVGESGKIYAMDANAEAIETLKKKAQAQGYQNVTAAVGLAESNVLCKGCADIVFYSMVLHDFENPSQVLKNARQMIKPSGLLVNLDWKKVKMPIGPPYQIRFSEHKAITLVEEAGFKAKSMKHAGKFHYILTAKPVEPKEKSSLFSSDI